VIEDLGLIAALRSLSVSYRENGSEVSCRFVDEIPELPLDTATALYRIAQEALRNAQKHGEGTPIYISLTITESTLQLAVCDTGPGFDPAHAQHDSGLGLLTMHERARLVNGTLMVRSQPGQGTVVSVIVPL
jgi:two-component system sensor histidine kinase UhpB